LPSTPEELEDIADLAYPERHDDDAGEDSGRAAATG
jgi:hypothetical protein